MEKAHIHGKTGATVESEEGGVSIVSASGVASVSGGSDAKIHSGDALVHLKAGKITLTVDGDVVQSNIHPGDAAQPKFDDVRQKWDAAIEQKEFDKLSELAKEWATLVADTSKAIGEYHDKIKSAEGNTDNGIEISSSDITLNVGGDKLSLKSGKCEILKSLKVT